MTWRGQAVAWRVTHLCWPRTGAILTDYYLTDERWTLSATVLTDGCQTRASWRIRPITKWSGEFAIMLFWRTTNPPLCFAQHGPFRFWHVTWRLQVSSHAEFIPQTALRFNYSCSLFIFFGSLFIYFFAPFLFFFAPLPLRSLCIYSGSEIILTLFLKCLLSWKLSWRDWHPYLNKDV